MKTIFKSWKTSLLGSGALAGAIVNYVQNPDDVKGSVLMAIVGLLGLISKDFDKTHSAK